MIRKTTGAESGSITISLPARRPAARAARAGHFSAARPPQASVAMAGSGSYLALMELACLDDRQQIAGMLQHGDVGKRVAVDDEQVCPLSGFDGACLGPDAE